MNEGSLDSLLRWATAFQLNRPWPEDVKTVPLKREPRKNRARPKHINKFRSISARCRDCGTLIVMRVQWRPGPIIDFAQELIDTVKVCHSCGHVLELPDLSKMRLTLSKED